MFDRGGEKLPIYGDNPKDPAHRKIFSACPIPARGDIEGYLETLLFKKDLSEEERERFLETALKQSDRLRRMVSDLFELSQLDAHGVRAHPKLLSLCELAQDIIQKFQLAADIGLMERTLENLVKNALQYTPGGGIVTISIYQLIFQCAGITGGRVL